LERVRNGLEEIMTRVLLSLALALMMLVPSQATHAQDAASEPEQELKGDISILLNTKFSQQRSAALRTGIVTGQSYASIRYQIGKSDDRDYIQRVLDYMARTLPATFGNTSGTYTVTLTISDVGGKLLVKEPIVSFTWTKERGLLFFDQAVNEVRKTSWKGTVINQMLVSQATERLRISIDILLQQNRSLDFDLMRKTAKTFSAGAAATYLALPIAALPIIDGVTGLLNDLYSGSLTRSLVDEDELIVEPGDPAKRALITFVDPQGDQYVIPVFITIETQESRLVPAAFANGRFDKTKISDALFNAAQIPVGEGKGVSLVELISTSSDARFKRTRGMLDALISGGSFGADAGREGVAARCGDLYDALNNYLSSYDARAMFWVFLNRYGGQLDKNACLGARQAELSAVGLDL
jgi:hypothetical protein